ncbi:MAG: hypothetical protein IJ546_02295 [Prevotella sp.]|nr:hypothetical protein [Prevotella sp.]
MRQKTLLTRLLLLLLVVVGGVGTAWADNSTFTVTFDSNSSGNNNIHVIASNFNNSTYTFTHSDISWNVSYTWQGSSGYFGTAKDVAQLGSKTTLLQKLFFPRKRLLERK